jgi:hypothetical protein
VSIEVVTWSNGGERKAVSCASLAEAKKLAKQYRTTDNKSVKICDPFGTMFYWSRVVGSKGNRWAARGVINDIFLGPE